MQSASLADCEALLAGQNVQDLPPLVREALFLRLSELDPRRLAELLLDKRFLFAGSREQWLTWLGRTHRDLLEEVAVGTEFPAVLKEYLQMTIARAEAEALKDPRQILEAALASGTYPRDHSALGKLADSDPHLAIHYFELLLKAGTLPVSLDGTGLLKMADADPARMQALMSKLRTPEQCLAMASAIARSLAATNSSAATAFFDSLPASRARSLAALDLVAAWSRSDPEAALAWIQGSLPASAVRDSAMAIALAPLAESDPKRVLDLLGPPKGGANYQASFNSYSVEGRGIGMSASGGAAHTNAESVRERAMMALVESEPAAAFAMIGEALAGQPKDDPDPFHGDAMNELAAKAVAAWMEKDPMAGIAWLGGLEGDTRTRVIGGLLSALQDLPAAQAEEAFAAIGSFGKDENASLFMRALAPSLTKADAAGALARAETLPADLRNDWLQEVITQMSLADPAAAAKEVARLPEGQRATVNSWIADQIAETSPREAVAFLDGLPPEAKDLTAYRSTVSSWVNSQAEAALEWWQQLPPGDTSARRGALPALAGRLYQADPSAASQVVDMIGALPEASERSDAAYNLIVVVAQTDKQAARGLVNAPGLKLSETERGSLKEMLGSDLKQ